jgi:hypothetical protein
MFHLALKEKKIPVNVYLSHLTNKFTIFTGGVAQVIEHLPTRVTP